MLAERANAKINLYLDVLSRRENGYHELYSIMQTVSLSDTVWVDFEPNAQTSIQLAAAGNDCMPLDSRNLAWRAAELFLEKTGLSGAVTIKIEKKIPMAAGLAGGSTDAAAVLRALNALCRSPLTTDELCSLGARLGADVPFCIVGGCAIAEGIGDRLTPHAVMPHYPMVVACMGEGVSTPWAYGELDRLYSDFVQKRDPQNGQRLAACLQREPKIEDICAQAYNVFESVVPDVQPYVNSIKSLCMEQGAIGAMMSGSGPSVFAVFQSEQDAERTCEMLLKMGAAAFVCEPTDSYFEQN